MIHKIIDLFVKEFLTPLHVATEKSHYDVMELLLKHGAKVNALGKHCKKGPPPKEEEKNNTKTICIGVIKTNQH